jgi:Ca2+/Na+ antiporter
MSSEPPPQTYFTHRRYHPVFHFITFPILFINVIVMIVVAVRHFSLLAVWNIVVAIALMLLAGIVRFYATKNQDRIIRAEETARLWRVLPEDLRPRIGELTTGQMIALRFCTDDDLPDLTRAILAGEVRGRENIKRRIRNWRPDSQRV